MPVRQLTRSRSPAVRARSPAVRARVATRSEPTSTRSKPAARSLWHTWGTLSAALLGMAVWAELLLPRTPPPAIDPGVAALDRAFRAHLADELHISSVGELKRDRDTTVWDLLSDHFGSNPNTPYMFGVLPLFGFLLPSPIYYVRPRDAVVLLSRLPPSAEYFSFTTFAAWLPRRGVAFSSLADSVNHLNIRHDEGGLFAHVVTGNARTAELVAEALLASGLPEGAVNLVALPSGLGLHEEWAHFETVLRLLRFANQTEGDAYLRGHHPVLYLRARHDADDALPTVGYAERLDARSVDETPLRPDFDEHGRAAVVAVGAAFRRQVSAVPPVPFAPLMIRGLECLRRRTECLGDCPDAAYFGPNIEPDSDAIRMVSLVSDAELHVVTLVNHRARRRTRRRTRRRPLSPLPKLPRRRTRAAPSLAPAAQACSGRACTAASP